VQPPAEGCLVGFRREIFSNPGKTREDRFSYFADYYEKYLGRIPGVLMVYEGSSLLRGFAMETEALGKRGTKLFIFAKTFNDSPKKPLEDPMELKDIINGKYESEISGFAQGAKWYGEHYGGFFISTMQEMNGSWNFYGKQPDLFKKAWQHVWEKFEERGTNQFATWVWSFGACGGVCPPGYIGCDNPNIYYPGNQFVDWIGWSAYARNTQPELDKSYRSLNIDAYQQMLVKNKPLMQAEFGKSDDFRQGKWLREAFQTIKSWPEIKAAIYWDIPEHKLGDDHRLNGSSFAVLQKLLKDPYFIMAKQA